MPSPYLPNTDADRQAMLRAIGVNSVDALFQNVPEKFRQATFRLPTPLSEMELKAELKGMADSNASLDRYACFLGGGFYHHFIPSVVSHITGRSEFYTAYTPYQPEISQGTLQALYDYQSLVCELTGMEVSNAGMYDGSSAAAEAALMACRITGREKVVLSDMVNPSYREVIATYVNGHDLKLGTVSEPKALPTDSACLIVQQPSFFGCFDDMAAFSELAHRSGALLVVITNPIALGMFKSPGEEGADIVVAEGQPLGNPMSFGGPGLGIFACRAAYLRQMPGRLVGKTVDLEDKPGFVLTLAAREQHIRRERATSNICTSEALVAIASAVYLAALGKTGLRKVAELCYHKAHYAAKEIASIKGYSLIFDKPFFNEFAVSCPVAPVRINEKLYRNGIIGGLEVNEQLKRGMLLCVTELNTRTQIDRLVDVLGSFGGGK
ncbi:MAG: aminomethyl-transferring glycine dehydrogenase subunit GcvPA [Chloroflexota bacterium]